MEVPREATFNPAREHVTRGHVMDLGSKLTFPQQITSLYFEHFLQATLLWALPSARTAVSVTSGIQYICTRQYKPMLDERFL